MTAPSSAPFAVSPKARQISGGLALLGGVALIIGLFVSPARAWMNLLVDGFYVLAIGVAAIFFIATQRLASARWSAPIRRIPEALMHVLPVAALLMVVLLFGLQKVYPWAAPHGMEHPHHALVTPGADTYLVPAFVYVRMAIVLALWMWFAWRIRRISLGADASRDAGLAAHGVLNRYSAVFTVLFAFSFTVASYDWIISLDPRWFSTMFSVYVFAGSFAQGIAAIALITVVLTRRGTLKLGGPGGVHIGTEAIHTLGTMLLAFCTFWAYIWVCQYLLIWYGNLPEEVTYYIRRTNGWWLPVFLASFAINWIIPFFTLLPRTSKRSLRVMAGVCILVLCGRWLDLYILVMPSQWETPRFGPLELAMAAGTAGLIYWVVVRALSRAPLVPAHDPVIENMRAHAHHAEGEAS